MGVGVPATFRFQVYTEQRFNVAWDTLKQLVAEIQI